MKKALIPLILSLFFCISCLSGLEVFTTDNQEHHYSLEQLRKQPLTSFTTTRFKHEQNLVEKWEGIYLQAWLKENGFENFQSIRFESNDNYMVRIHKAELDSMPGYLVLKKDGKMLDSTEVRIIFPAQRDMFWVRGVARIYLEDFQPAPAPRRIYIWEAQKSEFTLYNEPKPFIKIKGYSFDEIMERFFCLDAGSVILSSRDGLKLRLEYPKHLKGAVLAEQADGTLNLKSPVIPAGMWLKDIVYVQCGSEALLRYDYLYKLPTLAKLLDWKELASKAKISRFTAVKTEVPLEELYQPDAKPFSAGDWIELP